MRTSFLVAWWRQCEDPLSVNRPPNLIGSWLLSLLLNNSVCLGLKWGRKDIFEVWRKGRNEKSSHRDPGLWFTVLPVFMSEGDFMSCRMPVGQRRTPKWDDAFGISLLMYFLRLLVCGVCHNRDVLAYCPEPLGGISGRGGRGWGCLGETISSECEQGCDLFTPSMYNRLQIEDKKTA